MYEIVANNFISYDAYKQEVGIEIRNAQNSMVRIGYLLKVARDTDILSTSEYGSYLEFAAGEFGLDKSTVSRFININDKFSEGGNSDRLMEVYEGYGRAKLQEMLLLPDYINEELSPSLSKSEIQTIKAEVVEEEKITDIEVMLEPEQRASNSNLERFMYEILKNDRVLFEYMWNASQRDIPQQKFEQLIIHRLLTDEEKYYMARPAGLGKMMLVLRENGNHVLTNVRSGEKADITAAEIADSVVVFMEYAQSAEKAYELTFGVEIPEVAPVQLEKESKVTVSEQPKEEKQEAKEDEKPINTPSASTYPQDENISVDNEEDKNQNNTVLDINAPIADKNDTDLPFPDGVEVEVVKTVSYSDELMAKTNPELKKETIACCDQARICIYRYESWKDKHWFTQAQTEWEKLGMALEEIERRTENGTWRD